MYGRGYVWQVRGVCDGGHVWPWRKDAWQGACMGEHVWWGGGVHAGQTVTEVGGTHPTGMHSCL